MLFLLILSSRAECATSLRTPLFKNALFQKIQCYRNVHHSEMYKFRKSERRRACSRRENSAQTLRICQFKQWLSRFRFWCRVTRYLLPHSKAFKFHFKTILTVSIHPRKEHLEYRNEVFQRSFRLSNRASISAVAGSRKIAYDIRSDINLLFAYELFFLKTFFVFHTFKLLIKINW